MSLSKKRCNGAGGCNREFCSSIGKDTFIQDLENTWANHLSYPGHSFCQQSCGCAGCGCLKCNSGCLYYRIIAKETEDKTPYKIFACPVWQLSAEVYRKENKTERFNLTTGVPVTREFTTLTLVSETTPIFSILNSVFISNGQKVALLKGNVGSKLLSKDLDRFFSESLNQAENFNCSHKYENCFCNPTSEEMRCTCSNSSPSRIFTSSELILPLKSYGITINNPDPNVPENLEVKIYDHSVAQLQLTLNGYRVTASRDVARCTITNSKLHGCYTCIQGAQLDGVCTTDFGSNTAHVSCGKTKFSALCNNPGNSFSAKLYFSEAKVKEECTVTCLAGDTKFEIESVLDYIPPLNISQEDSSFFKNGTKAGDYLSLDPIIKFFKTLFNAHWFHVILIVLAVIAAVYLTITFMPLIMQISIFRRLGQRRSSKSITKNKTS